MRTMRRMASEERKKSACGKLHRYVIAAILLVLVAATSFPALAAGIDPPSTRSPHGVVRIWGTAQAGPLVQQWAKSLKKVYPEIRLDFQMTGSDVGIAGLYTAKADIAIAGRDITESEEKAFEWVFRYKPSRVAIMTGSVNQLGKSPALVAFVHKSNPLQSISLEQLGFLFGHADAGATPIRQWAQLGVGERMTTRSISLYAPYSESGTGIYFRKQIINGKNAMNWDALKEFDEPVRIDQSADDSARRILTELAKDPEGLAIASLQSGIKGVKPLAITLPNGEVVRANRSTISSHAYPLSRSVYAYFNRPNGASVDPQVNTVLAHILGLQGQAAVARDGGYLPLSKELVLQQQSNLE